MPKSSFDINGIKVIQAPLAGVSDKVFRKLVRKYSGKNCLMTTEMISSEMLCNNPNPRIIEFDKDEYPLAFQLVGHKVDKMVKAAKILAPYATMIDINCGCPVKKVIVSGDGSAMMQTPNLAFEIVKAIKEETNLAVSAKFRLGMTKKDENYLEFGEVMQKAGCSFVTLHGRFRNELYQGHSDWEKIAKLKKALDIPVFANGDVKTIEDAKNCLEITNANGISIGRGVMGDFTLPYRIEEYIKNKITIDEPDLKTKILMLKEHLNLEVEFMGEINGIKFMRKFYNYYISSVRNASKYRSVLVRLEKQEEIIKVLDEILSIHS